MSDISNTLNERQLQATTTTEGSVRIVAGAGSGKTRVLAHRYAFLVNDIGISPANILCMTFTNKAAAEMRKRIATMVDRGNVNDFICTIHGFCAKFLRAEIYRIGFPKNFIIIDEEDGKQLARQAMQEYGVDRKKNTAERFLSTISKIKGAASEEYITRNFLPDTHSDAPDVHTRYMRLQLKQYALDYDDLEYFTIYILQHFADARRKWLDKLNYIMVDEGQDCSTDDWRLIMLLAEGHGNLFVVGDPDQAIYEWRGASPTTFVNWKAQHTIILDRNYRSTPQILEAANSVIANNKNRIPKNLYTLLPVGPLPEHHHSASMKEENALIARIIKEGIAQGRKLRDFAVLYRASFLSADLERTLVKEKLPYTIWGGVKFLERKEIKDVLSYLRLVDRSDDMAFARIINTPSRKFGKVTMEKLRHIAESEGLPLYDTLMRHIAEKPFSTPAIKRFVSLIEECRVRKEVVDVSEIADYVLRESGYTDMLRRDEAEDRLENLAELINSIKDFEDRYADEDVTPLSAYLQDIALFMRESEEAGTSDAIRLMTIHQSKGLEFPVVFITGLTEGTFPSHRTIRERREHGEEEERRLMYVAVTRAMQRLYLMESEGFINDNGAMKFPSRYLKEIPDHQIERHGKIPPSLFDSTQRLVDTLSEEVYGTGEPIFKVGDRVSHKIFGEGVVEAYDKEADSYRVRFGASTRNLLPRVLQKL